MHNRISFKFWLKLLPSKIKGLFYCKDNMWVNTNDPLFDQVLNAQYQIKGVHFEPWHDYDENGNIKEIKDTYMLLSKKYWKSPLKKYHDIPLWYTVCQG